LTNTLNQNSFASTQWAVKQYEISSAAPRTDTQTKCVHIER
jgi:hypothetical protein